MIRHSYVNPSDDLAQYTADHLPVPRQEVTVDWYLDYAIDFPLWRWTSDDDHEIGLDPWRYHMDRLIKSYRKMPSPNNRAKLARYLDQHMMAICLATTEDVAFLKEHGFII